MDKSKYYNISSNISNVDNMNAFERAIKRFFDILLSAIGIICLSPVFFCIFIIQKCTMKGKAIFKQERIGFKGQPFLIYKFRTMVEDAEENGPQLAGEDDKRLTPFGRFLRKHKLDELPQLWNIIKGDMSIVGYRPERHYFIEQIVEANPDYCLLFCSRPGLTSHASVYNRYTYNLEKMLIRLDMDLDYLRKRTLWVDAKIIFQTIFSLFRGGNN